MLLNVCFNEMSPFRPLSAFIKGCSSYDRNGDQHTTGDGQPARNESVRRWETWASWSVRVFACFTGSAIVATRICAESADCLGSPTVVGIGRESLLQSYVLLSRVLKLDDQTRVFRINQLTWTLPLRASAGMVEYASRTVEDGGLKRLGSGCEPNPISADQIHPTHGAQSPQAHKPASSIVCGS